MKRFFVIFGIAIVIFFSFLALFPPELPPLPEINKELTPTVSYAFEMNGISGNQVELSHRNNGKPLFITFKLAGSWATQRPSLYLTTIGQKPSVKGGATSDDGQNGYGRFKKDSRGNAVSSYNFSNTIVEDKDGKQFLKMVYKGPDIPMVGTLILQRKLVFPAFVAKDFGINRSIFLKPGTYTLDQKLKAFYIEIEK